MNKKIKGIIVPLLTPILKDESLNEHQLEKLVNYVIDGGVDAIFANGTTGEFARFSAGTRGKIVEKIVRSANGRVPVYAGVSDCGTANVKENIRRAEAAGADAVVATLPYYFPNTSEYEMYCFFETIAKATQLPVILYNIPVEVGGKIPVLLIEKLQEIDNIIGVKDSGGDKRYLDALVKQFSSPDFSILVGDEALNYYGLSNGADGLVPSLANPFPKLLAAAYKHAKEKNWEQSKYYCDIVDDMNRLNKFSDSWMSPNIWRKVALDKMGIISSYFTEPYCPVDEETEKEIEKEINRYLLLFH
jgi:4-hydroxy-tetrahydrodipicolinate synthase